MNLGLESLKSYRTVPSMEELFAQYVACERMVENTNAFVAYGEQLSLAFENVCSLGSVACRYHSTEGLAVINALVKDEFGCKVSVETFKETAKKIWEKIKSWFEKAWTWIKNIYNRIMNFFFSAKKRLEALKKKLNDSTAEIEPFACKKIKDMPDLTAISTAANEDGIKSATDKAVSSIELDDLNVTNKNQAVSCIEAFVRLIGKIDDQKKTLEKNYASAKVDVKHAEGKDNIDAAKLAQRKVAAQIKVVNKFNSAFMKVVAGFMANCKLAG